MPERLVDAREFGTHMAAAGVPMRTLQEWMGHRDFETTLIYADYSPSAQEANWVERAFTPMATADEQRRAGAEGPRSSLFEV